MSVSPSPGAEATDSASLLEESRDERPAKRVVLKLKYPDDPPACANNNGAEHERDTIFELRSALRRAHRKRHELGMRM
eukprot:2737349-Pleurochrysis_carterae.AAC.1